MSDSRRALLVADVGKTHTRVHLVETDGTTLWTAEADGVAGLALPGVPDELARRLVALAATHPTGGHDTVSVGVAGALAAPDAADALAESLARAFGCAAIVTSDIVAAHLGALNGGGGTTLVAGTGAVAMGVAAEGGSTIVDGRGPDVGDLGSGAWIGRAGITAALRSADGVAPATGLETAFERFLHPHRDLPAWLAAAGNLGGRLGAFAPAVLDLADDGDPVAETITWEAVRLLTATAVAAGGHHVAVLGGLVARSSFRRRLVASLRSAGLDPVRPIGTALDGARLAATSDRLPHERHLHRAR